MRSKNRARIAIAYAAAMPFHLAVAAVDMSGAVFLRTIVMVKLAVTTKKIKIDLNPEELKVLATLVENQFLRMRFIDPKIPGYHIDPDVFRASQSAVALLSEAVKKEKGFGPKPGSNN